MKDPRWIGKENRMFNNIGKKLKVLAWITFIGGSVYSVVKTFQLWSLYPANPLIGLLALIGGVLGSWLGSWLFYGVGQIAEDTERIAKRVDAGFTPSSVDYRNSNYGYIDRLRDVDAVRSKNQTDYDEVVNKTDPLTAEVTRFKTDPVTGEATHLYDK